MREEYWQVSVFELKVFPAADGDCMLLTWGEEGDLHRMVVDGGRRAAYPHLRADLEDIAARGGTLELLVLTHVDADHIEGALAFAKDRERPLEPRDVWFNGYRQLRAPGRRSIRQGDAYSAAIDGNRWRLNHHFGGRAASVENADGPIVVEGLRITMLSPDAAHLAALAAKWESWLDEQARYAGRTGTGTTRRSGRRPRNPIPDPLLLDDLVGDGPIDTEVANGSSIAFIAEWRDRRVLFAGDAHPDLLAASLAPLASEEGGRYRLDLLKASHHGSANNTTRELVGILDCPRILLSSNGNHHEHPDPQSIARFLRFGPTGGKVLYFNYDTDRTRPWAAEEARQRYGYEAVYPTGEPGVLEIDLMR